MFVLFFTISLMGNMSTVTLGSFESRHQCIAAGESLKIAVKNNTYKYHQVMGYQCVERKVKK